MCNYIMQINAVMQAVQEAICDTAGAILLCCSTDEQAKNRAPLVHHGMHTPLALAGHTGGSRSFWCFRLSLLLYQGIHCEGGARSRSGRPREGARARGDGDGQDGQGRFCQGSSRSSVNLGGYLLREKIARGRRVGCVCSHDIRSSTSQRNTGQSVQSIELSS